MKKTLAVAGTVVALVVVPGMASAAEAVTVPASLVVQQSNCATDDDGGAKPVDEDNAEESGEDNEESPSSPETTTPETTTPETTTPETTTPETTTPETTTPETTTPETTTSESAANPPGFSSGRSSFGLPRQQAADDCSEALEPGSNYSDEDGDGEPEVKDQADDDGDGQVDEVDTASQVSVVPDGGAETGDGSTGGVIGMTSAGAAVLALLAGFGLWVRRALARA